MSWQPPGAQPDGWQPSGWDASSAGTSPPLDVRRRFTAVAHLTETDFYAFRPAIKHPDETLLVELDLLPWCANYWRAGEEVAEGEFIRPLLPTGWAYQCTAGQLGPRPPAFPRGARRTVVSGAVTLTAVAAGSNGVMPITSPSSYSNGLMIAGVAVSEHTKIVAAYSGGTPDSDFDAVFAFTLNGVTRIARQKVLVRGSGLGSLVASPPGADVNAVDVLYDNATSGSTETDVQGALDDLYDRAGVPMLVRRRYVIRNGISGIVSGAVDDAQATVNLAAAQAIVDAADENSGGVEMDQEEIQIYGGPLVVRSTAAGMIWDSPTYARLTQRSDDVGILQLGDTSALTQNLDFSGINLHYLNDQAGNTGAIACAIYNQWKARIGKIQVASTITSARPYAGIVMPQAQSVFSCHFYDWFVFRATQYLLYINNFGTGNVFENIYLSGVTTGGAAGAVANPFLWQIASGAQMHDGVFDQINIEWCISNALMRLNNVRGPVFNSLHLEQNILSGANATMINNIISNVQINSLLLLDQRIQAANASDFPSIHKAFNNGRTNIDTWTWINNNSSYVDRSFYEHYQPDSDGFTTNPSYYQKRSWRIVDGVGTTVRDRMIPDRTLGGTDMDGATWGNLHIDSANETSLGGGMSRIKGANLRVTTTKTLYGQYMQDAPTVIVPANPNSGADISITLSNMMGPPSSRWATLEIADRETVSFHRGGTSSGNVHILNHDGSTVLTMPTGAAISRAHVAKVNGDWVQV